MRPGLGREAPSFRPPSREQTCSGGVSILPVDQRHDVHRSSRRHIQSQPIGRRRQAELVQGRPSAECQMSGKEFIRKDGHHAATDQQILFDVAVQLPRGFLAPCQDVRTRDHSSLSTSWFTRTRHTGSTGRPSPRKRPKERWNLLTCSARHESRWC